MSGFSSHIRRVLARILHPADEANRAEIRVLQHLSCTGGTLFTKCLAAQPGCLVLNEIDPFTHLSQELGGKPKFAPSDIISMISRWEDVPTEGLIEKIFLQDIALLASEASCRGKSLLLRLHSHGTYLTGAATKTPLLTDVLGTKFKILSALTVRDPIDSFLSLKTHEWVHFEPQTFEEYCRRYLTFLSDNRSYPWYRYEDLVENPEVTIQKMCEALKLRYNPGFVEEFDRYKFSGDSGRTGDTIGPRGRRPYDDSFIEEVRSSPSYNSLVRLLGYQPIAN